MMGRFMALVPDLDTFAPVLGTSAAYGGGWALPIVCRFLALTRAPRVRSFRLIGTNGVRSGEDVVRMALCGASAVEVLSAIMHEGFGAVTRITGGARRVSGGACDWHFRCRRADGRCAYRLCAISRRNPERWREFVPPETLA